MRNFNMRGSVDAGRIGAPLGTSPRPSFRFFNSSSMSQTILTSSSGSIMTVTVSRVNNVSGEQYRSHRVCMVQATWH